MDTDEMRRRVQDQRHNSQAVIDGKFRRLRRGEPHTAPFVRLIEEMRRAGGEGCIVPDVDPEFGGTEARAFVLLNHPIRTTSRRHRGSGLLSLDNADQTAANCYQFYEDVGLDRRYTVHWNASPWMDSNGDPLNLDVVLAVHHTARALGLLHDLRIAALLGKQAQTFWRRLVDSQPRFAAVRVVESWSPGPPGINSPGRRRDQVRDALREVRDAVTPDHRGE
jgi:hypothetical protein